MSNYFFWGQEEYNIELEIQKIKEKYLDENFSSMNLRYYDAPIFNELQNILLTTGTMFGNIINIVSCDKYVLSGRTGTKFSDSELNELSKSLETASENIHTIFTLKIPRNIDNKDLKKIPSKDFCKILINKTQSKEFKQYRNYDKDLFNWVIQRSKEKELLISTDVAKYIIEQMGVNLKLIDSQLNKLKLCIYPQNKITKEHIKEFLNITEDIFKITDYMLAGKPEYAICEFKKICDKGRHPLEILAFLQSQFSKFISIKADIETISLSEVATKHGMSEYPTKILLQKMSNLTLPQLISIKRNLTKAEETIKIDYTPSNELEIEKAILADV